MTDKFALLIDEDSLGVDRYLTEIDRKIIKVGDPPELPLGTDDAIVAKYAKDHKCIVLTRDDKLVKQCKFYEVKYITLGMEDLARKTLTTISDIKD